MPSAGKPRSLLFLSVVIALATLVPVRSWALSSANVPLDSSAYLYLEKLAGMGLIRSDVKGVRPYSKTEVARLVLEAEGNLDDAPPGASGFARELVERLTELYPREVALKRDGGKPRLFDANPFASSQQRYVYLDGEPRSFERPIFIPGGQSAFGFIGGKLRPDNNAGVLTDHGTEGTPLLENNEGVIYRRGSNGDLRFTMEGYVSGLATALVEPEFVHTADGSRAWLRKGYVTIGGGGLALEVGRDANWFGPGYRGSTTLTDNAKNFDLVKLWSPEPLDVAWVKRWIGDFKYALIGSRFDETVSNGTLRRPWLIGMQLSAKPRQWFEWGIHFVRMEGGPGFTGNTTVRDFIFGGGDTNKNASIAGVDLRFRIPWLRNTEAYVDYSGSDSAAFWPIVESYVAGLYVPNLTSDGKNDLRFEFFYGNNKLYNDFKFPNGWLYNGMVPGHSQGGGTIEFFVRYTHWFNPRNSIALEYFRTDRGHEGRVPVNSLGEYDPVNGTMQALEKKNAVRGFWNLPLFGDWDAALMYGWEHIDNFNLVPGATRTNQLGKIDVNYRY